MFAEEWRLDRAKEIWQEEAMERGEARGRAEGIAYGEARGKLAMAVSSVRSAMESFKISAQQAVEALKIPMADRPAVLAAL